MLNRNLPRLAVPPAKPLDQYHQNIWDSFPHLQKPEPIAALVARRQAALKAMKASVGDAPKFSAASREEAFLAAEIRRRREPFDTAATRQEFWAIWEAISGAAAEGVTCA